MPRDIGTENDLILSAPLNEANGYCSYCHSVVYFMSDKERGYYKQCPMCGHAEHLERRPFKFVIRPRQWL
jgi:hypothetical protein